MKFLHFLLHPKTRGIDIDDPNITILRREIIQEKKFLQKIYIEWYTRICERLDNKTKILELGSGAGFLNQFLPTLITSEVVPTQDVQMVVDACEMPFVENELNGIVMTDVFHHIPDVDSFLKEAIRVINNHGKIVMIEPWRTSWSEWVYSNLHSEPFEAEDGWKLASNTGPLSSANGALPWIVFQRDLDRLNTVYPEIKVQRVELMMPFSYLLSGGVSMRSLMPSVLYKIIRFIENRMNQKKWAMFALIELQIIKPI